MSMSAELSVRDLRRAWKPKKLRLHADRPDHPTNVRFHRACSWLQRAEETPEASDLDLVLTCQWVAFNALYGRWDPQLREPCADRDCWRRFISRLLELDEQRQIASLLIEHKKLALAILDDAYLAKYFWEDPSPDRASRTTRQRRQALTWYVEERWGMILQAVVDRIYLLRCQLLHGAATFGGGLNRTSLRRCTMMLGHLVRAFLAVYIHHGEEEDWGPMCYPPMGRAS